MGLKQAATKGIRPRLTREWFGHYTPSQFQPFSNFGRRRSNIFLNAKSRKGGKRGGMQNCFFEYIVIIATWNYYL